MKTIVSWGAVALFFFSSCTQRRSSEENYSAAGDTMEVEQEQVEDVIDYDQSAGMLILEKLGEVYGTPPGADVGFTLDSPNTPDFIEGIYFDREHLYFQVTGDTAKARKILEEAAGSSKFKLESIPESGYSQKQLLEIQEELSNRFIKLKEGPLKSNVTAFGAGLRSIEVFLMVNTPEKQQEFRNQLMNSPALHFLGPEIPPVNNAVGVNDTLGVYLRPEYTVYPTSQEIIIFTLYNNSGTTVMSGDPYFITYEDEPGIWRELPANNNFHSIGYCILDKKSHEIKARLYPEVFPNKPGRYRFHYEVRVDGERIKMMTEFQLSNEEQILQSALKTSAPNIQKRK